MIPVTHKLVRVTSPAAIVNNDSLTCQVVDTKGFKFARYVLFLGATDIALTVFKVQESDTTSSATALDTGADITGAVYGTSTDTGGSTSALPTATDDNEFHVVEIDLRGRKRYLNPVITIGNGSTGAYAAVWCELYRGENGCTTKAQKGLGGELRVPSL